MDTSSLTGYKTFPIYNADDTPFHNLVLRRGVVDSIVMSLGDKITGEVYYPNNSLQVTMKEYIKYDGIPYYLVNPPTVVREGIVSDNSELHGMTKYSFEFYHPMYLLSNFPFTDVATKSGEEKYLSQNKSFSWIGKPQDYFDKLNKNLQGTVWYVRKSDRFPVEKDDELSDVQQFDNVSVAEAIKRGYEIWGTPYIVSQLASTDPLYAQGKRFVVEYGLPSNEIYASEADRQTDNPYVFRFGQGVGLKNNSRTPRNNKIVTRIAGYGSEDNVPYGYPQIVWTGNQNWDYTINNDPNNPLSYPIYKGIVGGQYVKLIKHPFTRTHLMPSIYSETVNKKVNPNAVGYDPTIEIKDYYDAIATEEYPYVNEINLQAPSYESHEFADIKPELDSDRSLGIVNAAPLNADLTPADHWDDSMDDDGNYLQSYFQITLPQLSFDLYACAAITQEMQINMRSGACIGCTFTVQVDWDDYKRNFYDEDGNFVPDGEQRDLTKYPKSNLGQISVVVQKDNSTFGTLMPNIYQQPKADDLFVFIGISLPTSYITNAEVRLDAAMKSYMLENNVYYFDYPLKFDEDFLTKHEYILSQIRPNSIIRFEYGGQELQLFVKQLTVKYNNTPLPQFDITLTDNVEVVLNQIGQVADDVEKLSSLIAILRQSYNRNVWNELAKKLSKTQDDTAQGFIKFLKGINVADGIMVGDGIETGDGIQVGHLFTSGILGEGGVFRRDADGKTYIETDKMYVRMKAYFDSVEIRDYQHTSGNRIASQARGFTASRVEWLDANGNITENINNVVKFRCYWRAKDDEHEAENQFVVGDQAFMEYSDVIDGNLVQKRFWRVVTGRNVSVTEDGEAWIDLSNKEVEKISYLDHQGVSRTKTVQGYEEGSSIPQAEDDICQLGNVWDSERQGAIIEYVSGGDAPSYQIFQGIDSFSLNERNMIGLGYSSQTGKAYLNVYGDTYIGDKPDSKGNAASYIRYDSAKKKLIIKAEVSLESTFDGESLEQYIKEHSSDWTLEQINALIHGVTDPMQEQIDGAIETHFRTGVPTLQNLPAIDWTTDTERDRHLGDLYYDKETGHGYRFMFDEEKGKYLWYLLTDDDVTEALRIANEAKETADGKRTIYSVWGAWMKSGVNTLKVGDLFVPSSDTTQGGVTYKARKVYKCSTDGKNAFQEINYTDDSALDLFKANDYVRQLTNGTISGDITNAQSAADAAKKAADDAQADADAAALSASNAKTAADNAQADATAANSRLNGWADNGVISPTEKTSLKLELENVKKEYTQICNDADKYGVSKKAFASAYTSATKAFLKYTEATPENITIGTDYNNISAYYSARQTILDAITVAAKKVATDAATAAVTAQAKADSAYALAGKADAHAALFDSIRQALNQGTLIDGGLVLSTLIGLRDENDKLWSGISGAHNTNLFGGGLAAWYGGGWADIEHKSQYPSESDWAKTAFRFDGSGYLAGGNITWDKDGIVTIANVYSDVDGNHVPWSGATLQYITNLSTLLPITIQSGVTYLDPQVGFKQLSVLGKTVATQEWVGKNYVSISFFERLFKAYNGDTQVHPNSNSAIDNIEAMFGFWTKQYISALGRNSSGGGSGGGIDMEIVWSALAGNTTEQINKSHLTTALAPYALKTDIPTLASLSWSGYSSGSYNGMVAKSITIPSNTNQLTNGAGYITSSALSGYATQTWVQNQGYITSYTDTKNTAGSTNTSSKIFLIGATSQATNPQTYSHDTAYVGTDGCLYSGGTKVLTSHQSLADYVTLNGAQTISATKTFSAQQAFTVAQGTSPFTVASNTLVKNLNADLLDGQNSSYYATASSVTTISGYFSDGIANRAAADKNGQPLATYKYYTGTFPPNDGTPQWYTVLNYTNNYIAKTAIIQISTRRTSATLLINFYNINTPTLTCLSSCGSVSSTGGGFTGGVRILANDNNAIIQLQFYASSSTSGTARMLGLKVLTQRPQYWVLVDELIADTESHESFLLDKKVFNNALTSLNIYPINDSEFQIGSSTYKYKGIYADSLYGNLVGNAASATKLQTSRTIWGQTFDGTGNVSGAITGATTISASGNVSVGGALTVSGSGNINSGLTIGTIGPTGLSSGTQLTVYGNVITTSGASGAVASVSPNEIKIQYQNASAKLYMYSSSPTSPLAISAPTRFIAGAYSDTYLSALGQNTSSDIRKKDIKESFTLSVEEISAAPCVRYLWKDNRELGIQVGSVAQYWKKVLPEAIHEDNDGYLTMQYGVISLLSTISIARKVVNHEERIKELEKENERLRTEVEQLRLS